MFTSTSHLSKSLEIVALFETLDFLSCKLY